ncbi:MAG: hypothetical protein PHN31_01740 [Candidatus Gracilibacteria bacterium]|nr:hypothetical protein [Candidatus Gracilibacteria bacterium]
MDKEIKLAKLKKQLDKLDNLEEKTISSQLFAIKTSDRIQDIIDEIEIPNKNLTIK